MMLEGVSEREEKEIWRARLAMALVSRRARSCPDKKCGRRRQCLGGMQPGNGKTVYHCNCPIMNETEWDAVLTGVLRVADMLRRHSRAEREAEWEAEAALPKKEREARRRTTAEASPEDDVTTFRPSYSAWLWSSEMKDKTTGMPRDCAALNAWVLKTVKAKAASRIEDWPAE
jgi:hypothetical protein